MNNKFGILGLSYDTPAGIGWPGARYAPNQIRDSFKWILNRIKNNEIFDTEANKIVNMSLIDIKDFGDVDISRYDHKQSIDEMEQKIIELMSEGYSPILLGGDHSVSNAGIKALYDRTNENIGIIHLDSHLDLVNDSVVQGKYSGSSEIRRAIELDRINGKNVVQIGIRGYNYPDHYHCIKDNNITVITPEKIFKEGIESIAEKALEIASAGTKHIYMTLDIDVLDSAFAPGTGANEPGGINTYQLFTFVKKVAPYIDVLDIVEVNPMTDYRNMTSIVASKIIFDYIVSNYYAYC